MMRSSLFISRRAPYSTNLGRDLLDAALASAAFGAPVSLLYLHSGVLQLLKQQAPSGGGLRNNAGVFESLGLYDINDIYVCSEHLQALNLQPNDLLIPVKPVAESELGNLIDQFDNVLSY